MRAVIQRIGQTKASIEIDRRETRQIEGPGLFILLGIEETDSPEDAEWLTGKISKMRIFADEQNAMNLSITDVSGSALVVSQFTLHASTKKGNRPSFIRAARPETAIPLYELFIKQLSAVLGENRIITGEFGADMQISFTNDGPVTIVIDSKDRE